MTRAAFKLGLAILIVVLMAHHAVAECRIEKLAEMPVIMTDLQPLVTAKVNGVDTMLMVDSGAFFTQISAAKAAELGLKPGPAPRGLSVRGVGGVEQKLAFVRTKPFSVAGQNYTGSFLVGGAEIGHDAAGVIGQNILGVADVEYDLAHGAVRLIRPHDCVSQELASWPADKKPSAIEIEVAPHRMTYGVAYVNGARMRVLFDTGSSTSMLTLTAARRAGIDSTTPGVIPTAPGRGIGRQTVQAWIAPVDTFKIGDEEVRHTHLRLTDVDTLDFDMLLGADFFLSHRVYVANDQHRLYFIYNGGPAPHPEAGTESALAAASEPTDAGGFARRGEAYASRHEYDKAIADLTRAVDLAPADPSYLFRRALAYQGNRQPFLAMADLDKSLSLKPDDIPALTTRAGLYLAGHDIPHALADLAAADRLAAPGADVRLALAVLYLRANAPADVVEQLDRWIGAHPEDSRRAQALGDRCFARALWNHDLGLALDDCDAALRLDPKLALALNSRGIVRLRQGDFAGAIADFDASIAAQPNDAWALYGRGLAKQQKGLTAEGKTDMAAAIALRPDVEAQAKLLRLSP